MNKMDTSIYDMPKETDIAWCGGCGNFSILRTVKQALLELHIDPKNLVLSPISTIN